MIEPIKIYIRVKQLVSKLEKEIKVYEKKETPKDKDEFKSKKGYNVDIYV